MSTDTSNPIGEAIQTMNQSINTSQRSFARLWTRQVNNVMLVHGGV